MVQFVVHHRAYTLCNVEKERKKERKKKRKKERPEYPTKKIHSACI